MSSAKLFAVAMTLASISSGTARAACNPLEFLLPEVNKTSFSSTVNLAIAQSVDESTTSKQDKNFMGSLLVDDVPFEMSYKDAKALSIFKSKHLQLEMSNGMKEDVLRIGVSSVGADAYKRCIELDNEIVRLIEINEESLKTDLAVMTLEWSPAGPVDGDHELQVLVRGGEINGVQTFSQPFVSGETLPLAIVRDQTRELALLIHITGNGGGSKTYFLPRAPTMKVVPRQVASDSVDIKRSFDYGDSLVSETKCVTPPPGGMLLPSTIHFNGGIGGPVAGRAYFAIDDSNSSQQVCATFAASGPGGKDVTFIKGYFTVYSVTAEPIAPGH
ncbi:hypothetical protein ELH92_18965 [Rhizobium ruizarguesonis]|uniref:hypothetical protein n=1 Tax=Rhizobium ruizarguesonis TaxID=2081791 RepID=UPI00102F74E5|nr:hypothetical protein [Rhizobium ruizarguesonis]TAY23186.1 hypothetical protein ELH92_18965 [Rhizobium ruizarguesonis]